MSSCPMSFERAKDSDIKSGASLPRPNEGNANNYWWPKKLNLSILNFNAKEIRPCNSAGDKDFDYKKAFESLDIKEVKKDIATLLKDSKPWWPADFGHYGPMIIRVAWHSAGTYRSHDGRGGAGRGQQRFAPLNSWPDNINTDKGRRILWPIKKKYGKNLSWADLFILAGNVALEDMGFKVLGFSGGREDVYEAENVYWGTENGWLNTDKRYFGTNKTVRSLEKPLAASNMGLIYVNPEGPEGSGDPKAAAGDIRETFKRMGMNDEETVALIVGGHTFGKSHGAADDSKYLENNAEAAPMEQVGLGWKSSYGTGNGDDTIVSGIEVTWTYHPIRWDNEFLHILYAYEWERVIGEGGHMHYRPIDGGGKDMVPMAHSNKKREPRMLVTDIALREDEEYDKIARRFKDDFAALEDAFAKAWFKLTHRDMGPKSRYIGGEIPNEEFLWQDPLPKRIYSDLTEDELSGLKQKVLNLVADNLAPQDFIRLAWNAAATFRRGDYRGGVNGGRISLEPQISWEINKFNIAPLNALKDLQKKENNISLADLIVFAAGAFIEEAAKKAGFNIKVPFNQGRVDASQEQTDIESFEYLKPKADGFVNYFSKEADEELKAGYGQDREYLLIDFAEKLGLTVPNMTVLLGGLRALGATWDGSDLGVLTKTKGTLDNSYFINLTDIDNIWEKDKNGNFIAKRFGSSETLFKASRSDLVFASNSELRAQAEYFAMDDTKEDFVNAFIDAWVKVMELDRFDLK